MSVKSLAVEFRPKKWDDVSEQSSTKTILQNQLETNTVKSAYLFCGAAGTGKTTCARIFANEINQGKGNPIELDAASNNSVDDVREIIQMAQTRSMDSEYKIFILDEVHALSNSAWQAMLKLIEEPPLKSIFIMCTTDPQKIPKTILSRVQRYDFKRISQQGIVKRLEYICQQCMVQSYELEALDYIARVSDGCMREAITMLDKCFSFSEDGKVTLEDVSKVIGTQDIDLLMGLTGSIFLHDHKAILDDIQKVYASGMDMKLFEKQYLDFILDVVKLNMVDFDYSYTALPKTNVLDRWIKDNTRDYEEYDRFTKLLDMLLELHSAIKWDPNPKFLIEARFLTFDEREV